MHSLPGIRSLLKLRTLALFAVGALVAAPLAAAPSNEDVQLADDLYTLPEGDTSLYVDAPGVMLNDSIGADYGHAVTLTSQAAFGFVEFNEDGSFIYTPAEAYAGEDMFTYSLQSGDGMATVTIRTPMPVVAPVCVDDYYQIDEDTELLLEESSGLLANDLLQHTAPLQLSILQGASNGTLKFTQGGAIHYVPNADWFGVETLVYELRDEEGRISEGVVTIEVAPVNDAPEFKSLGDVVLSGSDHAMYVSGWAYGISAGPANEQHQQLSFQVSLMSGFNLFALDPEMNEQGDLWFEAAAGATGIAEVEVRLDDDGDKGMTKPESSPVVTFRIHIRPDDVAPSFVISGNVEALAVAGQEITVEDFATGISGGWNYYLSDLMFVVEIDGANGLLDGVPAIDINSGALSFTIAGDVGGSVDVTVTMVALDGVHPGAPTYTFTITLIEQQMEVLSIEGDWQTAGSESAAGGCVMAEGSNLSWLGGLVLVALLAAAATRRRARA